MNTTMKHLGKLVLAVIFFTVFVSSKAQAQTAFAHFMFFNYTDNDPTIEVYVSDISFYNSNVAKCQKDGASGFGYYVTIAEAAFLDYLKTNYGVSKKGYDSFREWKVDVPSIEKAKESQSHDISALEKSKKNYKIIRTNFTHDCK